MKLKTNKTYKKRRIAKIRIKKKLEQLENFTGKKKKTDSQ